MQVGGYFMSESEQDAIIGKAVREHAEAERKLEFLMKRAGDISFAFERLSKAFREATPSKMVDHFETLLHLFEQEKVDWSALTPESLKGLVSGLRAAISERERTLEQKRKLI